MCPDEVNDPDHDGAAPPGSLACFQKMYVDLFDEHEHFYVDATMSLPAGPPRRRYCPPRHRIPYV